MLNLLKTLCTLNGGPSREDKVREYIKNEIKEYCEEIKEDNLKNLIAFKKGKKTPKNKICIFAHMDEVSFIINYIDENGLLHFSPVGGVDPEIVVSKTLTIENEKNSILAVVDVTPAHFKNNSTKKSFDDLVLDIGVQNKEEAQKYVDLYDFCYFNNEYEEVEKNLICAKALDDRLGCATMIELIKGEVEYDCYFVFTTREEIGCIGAKTSSFELQPDIAIVLECTTSCDNVEVENRKKITVLGEGVVISFMDKGAIYDKELFELSKKTAKNKNIKWQTKTMICGGNDSSEIIKSSNGCKVIAFSVPGRNLHTPVSIINKDDLFSLKDLTLNFIKQLN